MKVLLTENVSKLGKAGEIVNVADGYAKNYLIPKKLGIPATKEVLLQWESQKAARERRQQIQAAEAKELAKELAKKTFTVAEKAGENGKLFGAVTTQDIADALKDQFDLDIDKKKIVIPEEIKALGDYTVQVKLYQDAVADIRMTVVADA